MFEELDSEDFLHGLIVLLLICYFLSYYEEFTGVEYLRFCLCSKIYNELASITYGLVVFNAKFLRESDL